MLLVTMREKQLVGLVCMLFLFILIIFHLFLPGMEDRGSISVIRQGLGRKGNQILFPKLGGGHRGRHGVEDDGFDPHQLRDKEALREKVDQDQTLHRQRLEAELAQARLQLSKLRQQIQEDKRRLEDYLYKKPQRLTRPPSHSHIAGRFNVSLQEELQGGEPKDPDVKKKRDFVRDMMKHAWSNYERYAWRMNELRPVSKTGHTTSIFGTYPLGATIVDAIDTLYIMGMNKEYNKAKDWIKGQLTFDYPTEVSVFEFNIRFLGALLAMYGFTQDRMFVQKATELADRLLPAFNTETGLPRALVNLKSGGSRNYPWASGGCSILSEFGTLHLEFAYLSEATGNKVYLEKVKAVRKRLFEASKPNGLYPNFMNPRSGSWCQHHSSMAGLGDSFYEYLLKEWFRSGGRDKQARQMYDEAMDAVEKHMLKKSSGGFTYLGDYKYGRTERKMDHLGCFAGGMFALGSPGSKNPEKWFNYGKEVTATCHQSYTRTPTHLGPDSFHFDNGNEAVAVLFREKGYLLRPETIESYFYLWRLTKDQKYRDWGWEVAQAIEKHCRAEGGYSGIRDVYGYTSSKDDVQQSYFLAETLKYLYLLFSEDTLLPLDRWVFNTEAHPLPIMK